MKADDNWRETRLVAEDLENLLGIPTKISEQYFKIIENLLIHKFIELLNQEDEEEVTNKDYQIELPYLGSLVISVDEKDRIFTDFTARNSFYKKIKQAYIYRESPLVSQCGEILGQDLVDKYISEGGFTLE